MGVGGGGYVAERWWGRTGYGRGPDSLYGFVGNGFRLLEVVRGYRQQARLDIVRRCY